MTVPATMIPELDAAAADQGISRSALVTQALAVHLGFSLSGNSGSMPQGAITR